MKERSAYICINFLAVFHILAGIGFLYVFIKTGNFSKDVFLNGGGLLLIGLLFFASRQLFAYKNKLADPCFAAALISAALINGDAFEVWTTKKDLLVLGESIFIGSVLFSLFLWWGNLRLRESSGTIDICNTARVE